MIIRNKTSISAAFIVAGFVVAGLSLGAAHLSAADDSPTTLDQWLAQAMDKNPGILASKAKVAMAEAELRNVRFEVARQVVACWNEIDEQQRAIALAEEAGRGCRQERADRPQGEACACPERTAISGRASAAGNFGLFGAEFHSGSGPSAPPNSPRAGVRESSSGTPSTDPNRVC